MPPSHIRLSALTDSETIHKITASYSGSTDFTASSDTLTQTVN